MRHVPQSELQDAKQRLRELEELKLLSPEDLDILSAKRALRQKVSELEKRETANDRGRKPVPAQARSRGPKPT
jgi:hypothetical protein